MPLRGRAENVRPAPDPNAEWDELSHLVLQAWCWRDPESLERLEACLDRLRRDVERDWR